MSKYGALARSNGHSKWFLQKTLEEHDRSMDHPWMQMIYKQSFAVRQYAEWLARNHAVFVALEAKLGSAALEQVHEASLLRTVPLEADLAQLLGAEAWRGEAAAMVKASPATQAYLASFEAEAHSEWLVLAHHFLQYNAVLSGGAYLGKMVEQKLCVPHGAPGVRFYAFDGVGQGKEPARVQKYIKAFDLIEISEEDRVAMLETMRRIYADTEALMQECFELCPGEGVKYGQAKDGEADAGPPPPCAEQLELGLSELHGFTGADEGRVLMSLAGEILDVSAGRELYGPGGGYALLAGRDVTRCLATMSLEPSELDDLGWEPDNGEDEKALGQWREKLKAKYPVAGTLRKTAEDVAESGLRQRNAAASKAASSTAPAADAAADEAADAADSQKCPISGKEGAGCPMAAMMGIKAPAADPEKKKASAKSGGKFMKGKSLIGHVEEQKASGAGESWLWKLCPLHWDDNTTRLLLLVAAASWISGIFVGWQLHKQLMSP